MIEGANFRSQPVEWEEVDTLAGAVFHLRAELRLRCGDVYASENTTVMYVHALQGI